jgi:hypothetical protein
LTYTNNPLALAQFNGFHIGAVSTNAWPFPTTGTGGANTSTVSTYYDPYILMAGGAAGGAATSSVYTITYDSVGNLEQAIPQQSLPAPTDGSAVMTVSTDPSSGDATVVFTGGATTVGGSPISAVYTASLNTVTGNIASWSLQTALPTAIQNHSMAAYNGYVYALGGYTSTGATTTTAVHYAQVQNGQITAWNLTTPIPSTITVPVFTWVGAVNGYLFLFGGYNGVAQTECYYAVINENGSLGPWLNGPTLPTGAYVADGIPALQATDYGLMALTGSTFFTLGVSDSGPDTSWQTASYVGLGVLLGLNDAGGGNWQFYGITGQSYSTMQVTVTPRISVPLPVTGLTNGATYHVLMRQLGGTISDYLRTLYDFAVFPGNPTVLQSPRGVNVWTPFSPGGFSLPLQIFDQTAIGPILHTWEDSGARTTTIVRSTNPDLTVMGLCESTIQPGLPLNQTWNFEQGLGQWTATGGTLSQSSLYTYEQLTQSARVVPSGSASQVYALSGDFVPVQQGYVYTATTVFYTPVGYTQCSVDINWYDATHAYLSTTAGSTTSIAANTPTVLTVSSAGSLPATAVYAQVAVQELGTPPATAVFHAFIVALTDNLGETYDAVTQLIYGGAWPDPVGSPSSFIQLA